MGTDIFIHFHQRTVWFGILSHSYLLDIPLVAVDWLVQIQTIQVVREVGIADGVVEHRFGGGEQMDSWN